MSRDSRGTERGYLVTAPHLRDDVDDMPGPREDTGLRRVPNNLSHEHVDFDWSAYNSRPSHYRRSYIAASPRPPSRRGRRQGGRFGTVPNKGQQIRVDLILVDRGHAVGQPRIDL